MDVLENRIAVLKKMCTKPSCKSKFIVSCDKDLGSGNFGVVKRCIDTEKSAYAVKMVKKVTNSGQQLDANNVLLEEINMVTEAINMMNLEHTNIVKMMGFNSNPLQLLVELCDLGSLESQLQNLKNTGLFCNKQYSQYVLDATL